MAPSRSRAKGVAKSVARKPRPARKEASDSWELLERRQSDLGDVDDDEREEEDQLAIEDASAHNDPIDSLREMADRVGKEVESFAETLDRFLDNMPEADAYDAAHDLVLDFQNIALDAAGELEERHDRERREQLRIEWSEHANISTLADGKSALLSRSRGAGSGKNRNQVEELRRCKEEADTWELFRIILELHYNPNTAAMEQEKQDKLNKLGPVHRYTPENVLYERFLIESDLAKERAAIKTWLEQTVEHQQTDVQGITEELEKKTIAGAGLWTRGWLHTREKIKAEKRLRTWPAADSLPLPQLRRLDDNELLVTSLDPDAPARQTRSLERQDDFFEKAVWIACWEMLRRGKGWQEVCDWCESRKEGWRAVVMGKGIKDSDAVSLAAWRKMCFLASQSECSSDYEAAVYGLLGGNVHAIRKVGRTVDDQLFAHYSAALSRQFDQYILTNHRDRIPEALVKRTYLDEDVSDQEQAQATIMELIFSLRYRSETKSESISAFKILQSYLLANEAGSLIHTLGTAISHTDTLRDDGGITASIRDITSEEKIFPEAEIVRDLRCLRIAAHIGLVLQFLDKGAVDRDEQDMEDNVLIAYISALRAAGKRDLTPVYASRLQNDHYVPAMARVLQDITDSREREEMLSLMQQKELDVKAILGSQLSTVLDAVIAKSPPIADDRPLRLLEEYVDARNDDLYPRHRIRLNSLPDAVTSEQEALVRALEWYLQFPGHWEATFRALALALRKCLLHGHFACARLIVESFPYDTISQNKSYQVLGRSFNLMTGESSRPGNEREAAKWDVMQRQSKSYYDLELLVKAIEGIDAWRSVEATYTDAASRSKGVPPTIKRAFDAIDAEMVPLLNPNGFMLEATDDDEADDFARIRVTYLTEAILAWAVILHTAGVLITRDILLRSMDLATMIASEDSKLTETFQVGKRLRELVTLFAWSSRAMLTLKDKGSKGSKGYNKRKKDRHGRDALIWEIGPQGAGEGLEEQDEQDEQSASSRG